MSALYSISSKVKQIHVMYQMKSKDRDVNMMQHAVQMETSCMLDSIATHKNVVHTKMETYRIMQCAITFRTNYNTINRLDN